MITPASLGIFPIWKFYNFSSTLRRVELFISTFRTLAFGDNKVHSLKLTLSFSTINKKNCHINSLCTSDWVYAINIISIQEIESSEFIIHLIFLLAAAI